MRWFVEVKTFDGRWTPQVFYGDRPTRRAADGKQVTYSKDPILLPEEDYDLSLNELQMKYGSDEDMKITDEGLFVYTDNEHEEENDDGGIPANWSVQELANHFDDGLATLRAVIDELPNSQARNNTIIFMDTATLWAQQALQMEELRRKNVKAKLMGNRK